MVDLGFLSFRKESAILAGLKIHLEVVDQTVRSFSEAVKSTAIGDSAGAATHIGAVYEKETEADGIHRELSMKVAEGAFFGGIREDILNLLETIDNIADSAKDAVRYLSSDSALAEEGKGILQSENMMRFMADLESSVESLTTLVASFNKGKKEVLANVHTVEEFEEEADSDKEALLKELFERAKSMNPVTVIQLRDFVFVSDNIADNAEDASDVILVLVAKGYG